VLAALAERAGRLKLNGRLLETSPLTPLLEIELMRSAVVGKLGGWRTLEEYADDVGLDPERFATLAELAQRQLALLDRLHEQTRERAFRRTP
jgi:UDP-glucose 4-epimerase